MILRRVLILADESADWMAAGLRQLDRLALSLNELALENKEDRTPLAVSVLWSPGLDQAERWLPANARLTNIAFTTEVGAQPFDLFLSTRLFLYRNSLPQLLAASPSPPDTISSPGENELWKTYSQHLKSFPHSRDGMWEYITNGKEIDGIEKRFLRGSGKSQDGLVSRYLNRPISRTVTRLLLRFPTTPNAWTLLIFPIPVVGSLTLAHGTYWSFLWGLVLFQVFSVLDGCDGEIARAKFLESERGRQLDDLFDILSNILLVVGLGFGLSQQTNFAGQSGWFYLIEGLSTAALICVNESYLALRKPHAAGMKSESLGEMLYPRHRELVEHSGLLLFGERFASWLIQLTKRDVAVLFFVFLAAIGLPAWILHLVFTVTAISLGLAVKGFCRGGSE